MKEYDRILIPTDGSEEATFAVKKGLGLAKLIQAKEVIALYVKDLSALYYTPPDDIILTLNTGLGEEGKSILEDVEKEGKKMDVEVETVIEEGAPADRILKLANDKNIDIIVIGTIGRTGVRRLLLGSVAEKVSRHAPCPVLMVRFKKSSN